MWCLPRVSAAWGAAAASAVSLVSLRADPLPWPARAPPRARLSWLSLLCLPRQLQARAGGVGRRRLLFCGGVLAGLAWAPGGRASVEFLVPWAWAVSLVIIHGRVCVRSQAPAPCYSGLPSCMWKIWVVVWPLPAPHRLLRTGSEPAAGSSLCAHLCLSPSALGSTCKRQAGLWLSDSSLHCHREGGTPTPDLGSLRKTQKAQLVGGLSFVTGRGWWARGAWFPQH